MKALKVIRPVIILLLLVLFTTITCFAGKPSVTPTEHIRNVIIGSVKHPIDVSKHKLTGSVDVLFSINDNGTLDIKKISTDEDQIATCLKDQLSKITIKNLDLPKGQFYKVKISFKLC